MYQIWQVTPKGNVLLAEKTKKEVQKELHGMCIGQQVILKGNMFIMRVKTVK